MAAVADAVVVGYLRGSKVVCEHMEVSRRPWHSSHVSSSRCLAAQSHSPVPSFCAPPPAEEPRVLRRRHLDHQAQVR